MSISLLSDSYAAPEAPEKKETGDLCDDVIRRWEGLKGSRGNWEAHWQDIKELMRPASGDFNRNSTSGRNRSEFIFDTTAPWAGNELAASLHSEITPSSDRWFALTLQDASLANREDVLLWLEQVSDIIYHVYRLPESGFVPASHEAFLDLVFFGTDVLEQEWNRELGIPVFRTYSLAQTCIDENDNGQVDTAYRLVKLTTRQACMMFGEDCPDKICDKLKDKPDEIHEFVHAVEPVRGKRMPFRSVWVSLDCKKVVRVKGYTSFPYHISRWKKVSGEVYGRSPAMDCLPDCKVLNEYSKLALEAAQLMVRPPMLVPHDSFIGPLNMQPGGQNVCEGLPDGMKPEPLHHGSELGAAEQFMEQKRDHVARCFSVDVLRMFRKKERQTIQEILEYKDERLRAISPMVGRQEQEKLTPMIRRTYQLLKENGVLPEAPADIQGNPLKVSYIGEAGMAQQRGKVAGGQRFLRETVLQFAQLDPSAMDFIDVPAWLAENAKAEGVSRLVLRSSEEIAQLQQKREQEKQMAQLANMAPQAAGAIKDLSQAAAANPAGAGFL